MSFQYKFSYTSRLAQHCHILWTADEFSNGQLSVPAFQKALVLNLPLSSFNRNLAPLRYGRFYPVEILKTSQDLPARLFRVTEIDSMKFTADFNHPLAGKESTLEITSFQIKSHAVGKLTMLLEWAGIDSPLNDQETDYSVPHGFDRNDPSDDAVFYQNPRKVIHVDQTCLSRITALYGNLIATDDAILDLMSSWRSHLPPHIQSVTGLGMNAAEMADNAQLHSQVVHDLNRSPKLPFNDGVFHAVVNTVSVEYLTEPYEVFSEVRRVLKPGGLVIVSFSNRYFPPKTIRLWTELHPAERPGWVLQVLKAAGFSGLHCRVEQGLQRSSEDRYAGQVEEMDPLFAVWGRRGYHLRGEHT